MKETRKPLSQAARARIITLVAMAAGLLVGWLIDDLVFGLLMGFLVSLPFTYRASTSRNLMEYPPGTMLRIAGAGVFFLLCLILAYWVMEQDLDTSILWIAGGLTAIPGLLFVYTIGKAISQLDELQRRIQTEAMSIAFGLSALCIMVIGLLAQAGLIQPDMIVITALMMGFLLIGKLWTMWKYR